ncbi:hypothetical protein CFP56_034572, partial [Quercus suber]
RNPNASGESERIKKNTKLEIQIERVRKSNSECEEREIRDLTIAISPATMMSFFEGSLYGLEAGGSYSNGDLNQDKDDSNTESGNASILNSHSQRMFFFPTHHQICSAQGPRPLIDPHLEANEVHMQLLWQRSCAACLPIVKVTRHEHPLQLTHSLEIYQSNSQICLLCVKKVDTHLEYINLQELVEEQLHQSIDSATYKVKKFIVGEDRTKIATKIKHFSHKHVLKLTDEIPNNPKCNGITQNKTTPTHPQLLEPFFFLCILC